MDKNQLKIHESFVKFGKEAKRWTNKCILLLPEIDKFQIWKQKGFHSIYEYAAKLAGMNREKVNDALRILAKIEDKPALQKVVLEKGLGAVRPVAVIATQETADFWAEKAHEMAKNTLETYVREYKKFCPRTELLSGEVEVNSQICDRVEDGAVEKKKIVAIEIEVELLEKLEKLKGAASWNELLSRLLEQREKGLEQQKPEVKTEAKRYIPAKIKKFVIEKTNSVCAFPGCRKKFEIIHHSRRFALEKTHDAEKMFALCKNHERIAHHGLIENENLEANKWRIGLKAGAESPAYKIDRMVMAYRRLDV